MTPESYYEEVGTLGLTKTDVPTVFRDGTWTVYRVPYPDDKTSDQLEEIISELKTLLGVKKKFE
jgi:hypothetical protein